MFVCVWFKHFTSTTSDYVMLCVCYFKEFVVWNRKSSQSKIYFKNLHVFVHPKLAPRSDGTVFRMHVLHQRWRGTGLCQKSSQLDCGWAEALCVLSHPPTSSLYLDIGTLSWFDDKRIVACDEAATESNALWCRGVPLLHDLLPRWPSCSRPKMLAVFLEKNYVPLLEWPRYRSDFTATDKLRTAIKEKVTQR